MKRFLIHIILSICPVLIFSQDIQQTLAFADGQYEIQNYEAALKSYKRILFFDQGEMNEKIQSKIANCYFHIHDFQKALFHYDLAFSFSVDDSLSNEYILKRVLIYVLQDEFFFALQELLNVDEKISAYFLHKKEFYHAIIDYQTDRFDSAEKHFIQAVGSADSVYSSHIKKLFGLYNLNKPNPKTAKVLSIFLPGAGQLYAGDFKNAINSFLLTAGFACLFIVTAKNLTPIDALLSVFPWFQRYYMGGFAKAEYIAILKKEEKKQQLFAEIMRLFDEIIK
ncbi:MAG: hypothetical protein ISR55_07220 [Bacteroidetes bacterium]|nr:hypothetical protein [Bacteroidota bacterium]